MKIIRKVICSLIGHNYQYAAESRNQGSVFGFLYCSRCKHEEVFQFDFPQ